MNKQALLRLQQNNKTKKYNTFDSFVKYCYENMNGIRSLSENIEFNENWDGKLHIVFYEFNERDYLEFIIRNSIVKLGNKYKYSIICGNDNIKMIRNFKISNLNIIKKDITNATIDDTSLIFGYKDIWEELDGEYILICDSNSIIFNSNIDKFLKYDYISSPWLKPNPSNKLQLFQGPGGFSLRNRKKMIEICEKNEILEIPKKFRPGRFMAENNCQVCPDDVFFNHYLLRDEKAKLPDFETCKKFSIEEFGYREPFGGHNFYRKNWKVLLNYNFDENIMYNIIKIPQYNELVVFDNDNKVLKHKFYHSDAHGKKYVELFEKNKLKIKKENYKYFENIVILAKRFDFNWRHFLIETFFDISIGYKTNNTFIITKNTPKHVLEIFNILNIENYYVLGENDLVQCKNIITETSQFKREEFMKSLIKQCNNLFKIQKTYSKDLQFFEKIFLTRNNTNKFYRYVSNQDKLNKILNDKGYFFFEGGRVPLYQQIALINNAKVITTQIGANCDNIIFCNSKCVFNIIYPDNCKTWVKMYQKYKQCRKLPCGNNYENNGNSDKYNWNYTIDFDMLKI